MWLFCGSRLQQEVHQFYDALLSVLLLEGAQLLVTGFTRGAAGTRFQLDVVQKRLPKGCVVQFTRLHVQHVIEISEGRSTAAMLVFVCFFKTVLACKKYV